MPTPATDGAQMGDNSHNRDKTLDKEGLESKTAMKQEPSERELLMERMDRQIEETRTRDEETFFQSGDPRAVMLAAEMGRESRGEKIQADSPQGRGEQSDEAVPAEQEADAGETGEDDAAAAEAAKAVRVSTKGADPLAEYIVRDTAGKAMFKTVVDGKTHFIPVDKARAQLQKHLAADIRLNQASQRQAQLDAREKQIQVTEATLKLRASQREAIPIVDDAELDRETADLVRSLVSKPEAEAAKQMAALMKKVRQASPPQIDIDAIVGVAVMKAKQEIAAENDQRALEVGLTEFTQAYPDIAGDPDLFNLADRKTNAIAAGASGMESRQGHVRSRSTDPRSG